MIGLYVHIPFCRRKCAYCDFYSTSKLDMVQAYVDALTREMHRYMGKYTVDTIFIGGGTPSLLSVDQFRQITRCINECFDIVEGYEFTVECNPDSVDEVLLCSLKEMGVNRLSIGVQSLQDDVLRIADRLHTAAQAVTALETAARVFENVNADYIVGFPSQTPDSVASDMRRIMPYVKHVSVYSLILEQGTPLFDAVQKGAISLPDDDTAYSLYQCAFDFLQDNGFIRYEISNFSRRGYHCRHNLNCWRFHDYLGIGAAAHSFLADKRFYHESDLDQYVRDCFSVIDEGEQTTEERKFEMIMLGLRTVEGVDLENYRRRFQSVFTDEYHSVLLKPSVRSFTTINERRFAVNPEYLYASNQIILEFMQKLSD